MTGPEHPTDGGPQGSVWIDDAPVDPAWAPPPEPDAAVAGAAGDRRRRRLLTVGIPVLALVVLIGSVWALGGFADRDDTVTKVAVGKTFTNGPYEFRFTGATVQETEGFGKYKRIQKVVVNGTIRNIGDEAISPNGDWFLARGRRGAHIETAQTAQIGDSEQFNAPQDVTPGLPPVRLSVDFEFPPSFDDTSLLFVVGELTYGTHSYLSGDDGEYWDTGNGNAFRLSLPITRLAPEP